MKLDKEKISSKGYFRIGFDKYSGNYLMEMDDSFGNNRYFIISEEQYKWFDTYPCAPYSIPRTLTATTVFPHTNVLFVRRDRWWMVSSTATASHPIIKFPLFPSLFGKLDVPTYVFDLKSTKLIENLSYWKGQDILIFHLFAK